MKTVYVKLHRYLWQKQWDFQAPLNICTYKTAKIFLIDSANTIKAGPRTSLPSTPPHRFFKNFYKPQNWNKTSPLVDLLETGLWTYRKLVCGPMGNRFVDMGNRFVDISEIGLWTYVLLRVWWELALRSIRRAANTCVKSQRIFGAPKSLWRTAGTSCFVLQPP